MPSLRVAGLLAFTAAVAQAFKLPAQFPTTAPNSTQIPQTFQTTGYDVATQCKPYTSSLVFNKGDYPIPWTTATQGTNTSAEWQALRASIDWNAVPKIAPRKLDALGALVLTGYDIVNDPDCWWSASGCSKPKAANIPADITQCPEPETWGLTFDDGPNCSHNAFYDYLQQHNLKATMFYVGSNVMGWPYGAVRGLRDGHHLAVHTWSHQLMTTLTNDEVLAELYYTMKAIKYVTGVTPLHWRPPQGDVDDRVRAIAAQLNLTCILWNQDTDDWKSATIGTQAVQQNYNNYITMGQNGTYANIGNIVLSHEINNTTMSLAVQNLPAIQKAYKHVLDVATCMNITKPYMETDVTIQAFGSGSAVPSEASPTGTKGSSSAASITEPIKMLTVALVAFAVALL